MISHGGVVNFGGTAFLRAQTTGEIAEMIDRQRQVGVQGFADWFAVIPALRYRQILQILLNAVGDLQQKMRTLLYRGSPPGVRRPVCRIKGQIDIFGVGTGKLRNVAPIDGRSIHEIFAA